jgi:large subunit ribosomal protein L29
VSKNKAENIRRMSPDEMTASIFLLKKERFNLRFQKATGQLENTSRLREARREIARIKTIERQMVAGAFKSRNPFLAKAATNRHDAPRKGQKNQDPDRIDKEHQGDRKSSAIGSRGPIQLVRGLRARDEKQRIAAMHKLQDTLLSASVAKHGASRLLPLLVSRNQNEAVEAAITLCKLTYPDRYKGKLARDELLTRVRSDLPKALHARQIDFVTHVDAKKVGAGKVELHARLSNELPFTLNGERTKLQTPEWIQNADDLVVVVSGPSVDSKSVHSEKTKLRNGDISAVKVECNVQEKQDHKLTVDFIMDNKLLKRRTVSY